MLNAVFSHYITDNDRYTTMTVILPEGDNTLFDEGDKVIIEYTDKTADSSFIIETKASFAEFRIEHGNFIKRPIKRIQIADKFNIQIEQNQRTGLLTDTFRREITSASANAKKKEANNITSNDEQEQFVQHKKKEVCRTEKFGIGFSSGIISMTKEGIGATLAYGAYLSLFNIYADFRMMPTIKQQIDDLSKIKTSIYQVNAGYRINILEGFGITPLIGITKVNSKVVTEAASTELIDKTYINYGILFDHIYRHHSGIGIKTGIAVQRHNFGATFGVAYNW